MAKKNYGFEILLRGVAPAYAPEELVDRFKESCNDIAKYAISEDYVSYEGRIKVQEHGSDAIRTGYYNRDTSQRILERLAFRIYKQQITSNLTDMQERIKTCDIAINALKSARVGVFGDVGDVKRAIKELNAQREFIQELIDVCNKSLRVYGYFEDIPEKSKDQFLKEAKEVLDAIKDIFIIQEPTAEDVVGETDGKQL